MNKDRYIQPGSCRTNGIYYLKIIDKGGKARYLEVKFLSYRPHPAEVVVHDGDHTRVIHRRFLYSKESDNGRLR